MSFFSTSSIVISAHPSLRCFDITTPSFGCFHTEYNFMLPTSLWDRCRHEPHSMNKETEWKKWTSYQRHCNQWEAFYCGQDSLAKSSLTVMCQLDTYVFTQTSCKLRSDQTCSWPHRAAAFKYQSLGATKMPFSGWVDKLWHPYYSEMRRNEPWTMKLRRDLKYILVNVRSPSERSVCCMAPTKWHWDGEKRMKMIKINKYPVVTWVPTEG